MKYNNMDWGTMEAIVNKLGGMEGVQHFLSGKTIVVEASKYNFFKETPKQNFKVWKTITLTAFQNVGILKGVLKAEGIKIGVDANFMLNKCEITTYERDVHLINVSVADLGFKSGEFYDKVCAMAKELGLKLCHDQIGPQLRLDYKNQPKGERLYIGMKLIPDSRDVLTFFSIENDGDLRLNSVYNKYGSSNGSCYSIGDCFLDSNERCIFSFDE